MVSTHTQSMIKDANEFAERLILEARIDVKQKLTAVNKACQSLLESGGELEMPIMLSWIATNYPGMRIASQSLMNTYTNPKTGEKEPVKARQIFNKYKEVQEAKLSNVRVKRSQARLATPDLSEREMLAIEDHQVRYKVQLLSTKVRNLNKQLDAARKIQNLPMVPMSMLSAKLLSKDLDGNALVNDKASLLLSEEELDALEDFMKPTSLKRRKMDFDSEGILNIEKLPSQKRETVQISRGFLEQALRKVLASYGHN